MGERAQLLSWYDEHARELPWRRTRDPYAIWVSEVMLQQTRVETVLRYYDRFMARFPTTAALAAASEDDVMASWSGLGYYRRARLLHAGAREALARYGGSIPRDPIQRRALPGVGRYTAGAIGSIAFDLAEPIVDGNVARVLARLRGIGSALGLAETERALWQEAEAFVAGPRPGDLNQALMELGATVCTKAAPRCTACPIRADCVAHREGRTTGLPVPKPKRAPTSLRWVAVHARSPDGATYLVRSEEALFGGLWGLPIAEGTAHSDAERALATAGLAGIVARRAVRTVEHVLTHRHLTVRVYEAPDAGALPASPAQAVQAEGLGALGIATLTRKLLGDSAEPRGAGRTSRRSRRKKKNRAPHTEA